MLLANIVFRDDVLQCQRPQHRPTSSPLRTCTALSPKAVSGERPGRSSSQAHGEVQTWRVLTQINATCKCRLPRQHVVIIGARSADSAPGTSPPTWRSDRQRSSYQVRLRGQPGQICPVTRASLAGRGWISKQSQKRLVQAANSPVQPIPPLVNGGPSRTFQIHSGG